VSASPDGARLACSGWLGTITLISADGQTTHDIRNRNTGTVRMVRFSDDGKRLATWARADPETVVWSVQGEQVARLRPRLIPFRFAGEELTAWRSGPDGRGGDVVSWVEGRTAADVRLHWDSREGALLDVERSGGRLLFSRGPSLYLRTLGQGQPSARDVLLGAHGARVESAAIHTAADRIVSLDENRVVRLWSSRTSQLLRTLQGLDPDRLFWAPALDRQATRFVWSSLRERATVLWDLAGPPDAAPLLMRRKDVPSDSGNAVFLGKGRQLASANVSNVAFWPVAMPWPRVLRGHASSVVGVGFAPESTQLVSCATDGVRVWPMSPEAPPLHSITFESGYSCYGIAPDPADGQVLIAATAVAGLLAPLRGGQARVLVRVQRNASIEGVALDASGRWAALSAGYSADPKDRLLHIVDRSTGAVRAFPLPGATTGDSFSGGVASLRFAAKDRLIAAGSGGLRAWDVTTGESRVLHPSGYCLQLDAGADGRYVVTACLPQGVEFNLGTLGSGGQLFVVDLQTSVPSRIDSHGDAITAVAITRRGDVIASGDTSGVIRVGRVDGSEPHLLVGPAGTVTSLAFSPDGRWLASASGNEVRLWPMPDVSRPPLHTLPLEALLAKMDSLTNLRVVEDPASPTGFKVEVGPFPGWREVPTW
jgi:WD40 repeat protein